MALTALDIMDHVQAVHPKAEAFVQAVNEAQLNTKYTEQWLSQLLDAVAVPEYLYEDDIASTPPKAELFAEFVSLGQKKFVEGDFKSLSEYIARTSNKAQFVNHCTSAENFINNRLFEFLFYQVVAKIYDRLWPLVVTGSRWGSLEHETSVEESLQHLEKKLRNYYGKSTYLLKSINDLPLEIAQDVEAEFEFYRLAEWYLVMAKFSGNHMAQFVQDFDRHYSTFSSVATLNLQSEMLIMYSIASMACKPFKELTVSPNEQLIEQYTEGRGIESSFFNVMYALAHAEFTQAKSLMNAKLIAEAESIVSYMLPQSNFWRHLTDIIDLKVFLLIISVTSKIPRSVLVERMGYVDCSEAELDQISDKLLELMSVLQLGKVNITYNQEKDIFCHGPVDNETRYKHLSQQIDQIDRRTRADAAAHLLRGLLVEKYL